MQVPGFQADQNRAGLSPSSQNFLLLRLAGELSHFPPPPHTSHRISAGRREVRVAQSHWMGTVRGIGRFGLAVALQLDLALQDIQPTMSSEPLPAPLLPSFPPPFLLLFHPSILQLSWNWSIDKALPEPVCECARGCAYLQNALCTHVPVFCVCTPAYMWAGVQACMHGGAYVCKCALFCVCTCKWASARACMHACTVPCVHACMTFLCTRASCLCARVHSCRYVHASARVSE